MCAWPLHGRYMAVTWPLHGRYMAGTWPLRGRYVAVTCPLHAPRYMAVTWPLQVARAHEQDRGLRGRGRRGAGGPRPAV